MDPRPWIAELHHVAHFEMGLQPRAVELVDESAHFERAEQEPFPDVFHGQKHLGLFGVGDEFGEFGGEAVPGVLVADIKLWAGTDAAGIKQNRSAVPFVGEVDGKANGFDAFGAKGRVGNVEKGFGEQAGIPEPDHRDAGFVRSIGKPGEMVGRGVERHFVAHAKVDTFEPSGLGGCKLHRDRHLGWECDGADALAEAWSGWSAPCGRRGGHGPEKLPAI